MTARPSSTEMLQTIAAANRTVATEYSDLTLPCALGSVPPDLAGVLFRNGPGRLERGGVPYGHPFDGDGHIVRLAFDQGQVHYTNRFVRTRGFVAEEAAGRILFRGFGTNRPGGLFANLLRLNFKNTANTNVIWHGGRLLALWEGGLPHRLDPRTLETLGTEDFDGRLRNPFSRIERALAPYLPFSAHPHLDADTGDLYNFGMIFGARSRLILYRVAADGALGQPRVHELERLSFVHDFALTGRYLVFLLPHADFDIPRAILGLASPVASLKIATDRPLEALLIPRDGGPAIHLEAGPGFVFHIAQGHDREDGTLVLDVVRYPEYPAFDRLESLFADDGPAVMPRLERLLLDPGSRTCRTEALSDRGAELPRMTPETRDGTPPIIYSLGAPPDRRAPYLTCIQRLDTGSGEERVREFAPDLPGEPIPVPGCDGAVWILTLIYRAQTGRTDSGHPAR